MATFFRQSMIARLLGLAAVVMLTAGAQSSCSVGSGTAEGDVDLGSGNGPTFTSTLVLRDTSGAETYSFHRLELITFEFTVRNLSAQPVTLPYTGVTGSVLVFHDGGHTPIWNPFHDTAFAQAISYVTIGAGESRVFTHTWNQVLPSGSMLPRGHYQARGVFLTPGVFGPNSDYLFPHELGSNLRGFTIR
jgi:hypothetical protein